MDKRITTSATYELPIKDFDYVKDFISNLSNIKEEYNKSDEWVGFAKQQIESGLKVVFMQLWDLEEQWLDEVHYPKEMAIEAFMGFNTIGSELHSMGDFIAKDIESLCNRYENNPDFIFTQLDWDAPKEVIIKEFLDDLTKGDFIEDTSRLIESLCTTYMEDNVCVFEIYDTTYEEVCGALAQIEKEIEEEFDRIHPKPYPQCIKKETERYRNEVVYHREIQCIDEKDGFCRFYIINEMPELIHGLLHQLNKKLGQAELFINDKTKRPHAKIDYGVYVFFLEVKKEDYEKEKYSIIEESKYKKRLNLPKNYHSSIINKNTDFEQLDTIRLSKLMEIVKAVGKFDITKYDLINRTNDDNIWTFVNKETGQNCEVSKIEGEWKFLYFTTEDGSSLEVADTIGEAIKKNKYKIK